MSAHGLEASPKALAIASAVEASLITAVALNRSGAIDAATFGHLLESAAAFTVTFDRWNAHRDAFSEARMARAANALTSTVDALAARPRRA